MAFNSIFIVLPILSFLMFQLGLELTIKDFTAFRQHPKALYIGLFGQVLLLPLIAWGLIQLCNPSPIIGMGIMILACCPGGASSNTMTLLAKGNIALSISLTAISSLLSLITLPLFLYHFTLGENFIQLPIGKLFAQNIIITFTPLLIGMLLRSKKEEWSRRAAAFLKKYSISLLIILIGIFFIENRDTIMDQIEISWILLLLLIGSMSAGGGLAQLFGIKSSDRKAITIEIGIQNAAQAIAIAASPLIFNSWEMAGPAVIYALLMNLVMIPYLGWVNRKKRSHRA